MLGLAPEGLGKLLPLTTYTCVRCGHENRRLSETWAKRGLLPVLAAVVVAALGAAVWFGIIDTDEQPGNTVRQEIQADTQPSGDEAQPATPAESAPTPAKEQAATAPEPTTAAIEPPSAPAADNSAEQTATSTDQAATAETVAIAEPAAQNQTTEAQPAPEPKVAPAAQAEPAPALEPPSPAPAKPKTTVSASGLEEVDATAAPKTARPKEVGKTAKPRPAAAGWNAELTGLTTGEWKDAQLLTLGVKGLAGDPTGFQLSSPPRYVVDVPGSWSYKGAPEIKVGKGLVKAVRLGLYPDKLRVVVDLSRDAKQASVRRTDQGLVITLR